jgi:hypothetical protein
MNQPAVTPQMEKKKIKIRLVGCDETTVLTIEATPDQVEFLEVIAAKSEKESSFDCMPTMQIEQEIAT